ncbi:Type 1 glutamine amidotransferase-like domain-containing protein [Enterococcus nangangensis]|uniref:Type 1 glutamine amidotransferase-like domain-containing protein n=1 Tax=Enterococcus nangangensis TaxID=2559926 RepID=UPI0010F4CC02|nr:Type 1 glutamine amidotransferase-like domain-containing protein [Enterococcus nangangensis]
MTATNILLSMFPAKEDWNEELEFYLKNKKVFILAFSFPQEFVQSAEDWQGLYAPQTGKYYNEIVQSLTSFGVQEADIHWGNYFLDSKGQLSAAINAAEVLFLPGGAPDEFYERLLSKELVATVENFTGKIIGFSAGAMIQIANFHITPDDHYLTYTYHQGLKLVSEFDIEVHYEAQDAVMNAAIKRCIADTQKPVYAIGNTGGLIRTADTLQVLGDVTLFKP